MRLGDGRKTTVHVARHDAGATRVRVALVRGQTLSSWCLAHGIREALVGGFFTRPACEPLGELRTGGIQRASVPFDEPWGSRRACVHIEGSTVGLAARDALPALPPGDLLQAGPLLVRDGAAIYDRRDDREGFSAGSSQFDSDITAARHPRAALALADGEILAVACDGRSRADAGLTLEEFAAVLVDLGAHSASTSTAAAPRAGRRAAASATARTPTRASRSAAAARRDRARLRAGLEPERGLEPLPTLYKSVALPTELLRPDLTSLGAARSGRYRVRCRAPTPPRPSG